MNYSIIFTEISFYPETSISLKDKLRVGSLPVLAPKVANTIRLPQVENSHLLEPRWEPPGPPPPLLRRGAEGIPQLTE